MPRKLTIEFCNQIAKDRNGFCLSTEYKNCQTKMLWQCKEGHQWKTTFSSLLNGSWCKKCYSEKQRNTIKDCNDLANKKDGRCLSEKYIDAHTPLTWKCKDDHVWEVNYNQIQQGYWCPYCAGNAKKTLQDAKNLAALKKGLCLSTEYKNWEGELVWKCDKNHVWETSYNQIQQGGWCPFCKSGKSQRELFEIIKSIYPNLLYFYNFREFEWLKTRRNGRQEIDIYVKDANSKFSLGIEYDGKQHFIADSFFGTEEDLSKRQQLDALKEEKIRQHPEDVKYFIRFNYKEKITKEYVLFKLKENNIPTLL